MSEVSEDELAALRAENRRLQEQVEESRKLLVEARSSLIKLRGQSVPKLSPPPPAAPPVPPPSRPPNKKGHGRAAAIIGVVLLIVAISVAVEATHASTHLPSAAEGPTTVAVNGIDYNNTNVSVPVPAACDDCAPGPYHNFTFQGVKFSLDILSSSVYGLVLAGNGTETDGNSSPLGIVSGLVLSWPEYSISQDSIFGVQWSGGGTVMLLVEVDR